MGAMSGWISLRMLFVFVIGGIAGLVVAGGTASYVMYSDTLGYCISCHEMRDTVYPDYIKSAHYKNKFGVRVVCAQCHVPHDTWMAVMIDKIKATFIQLPNHFLGTIDTKEKFEAHRLELAKRVWAQFEANDSQQCRSCHKWKAMILSEQRTSARTAHEQAIKDGKTCIDCHKGITHTLPKGMKSEQAPKNFTF